MTNLKIKNSIDSHFKQLKSKEMYNKNLDSLEFVNLILAIQKKFKIKFNLNELNKMKKIDDIKNILLKKCQKN
mgnify:CR=1 FL=1